MRIIAGTYRGHRVAAPPGQGTRPMLDRVREALFSTLGPWLEGAQVLDLFAGSGCLSLEALSRGARLARLVELDPKVVQVAARNIQALGLSDQTQLVCGDGLDLRFGGADLSRKVLVDLGPPKAESAETAAGADAEWASEWDIILCDPPYPLLRSSETKPEVLKHVRQMAMEHLAPEGVFVLHAPGRALDEPDLAGPGLSIGRRTYGTNAIWFVQKEAEGQGEALAEQE